MSLIQIVTQDERFDVPFGEAVLVCRRVGRLKQREIEKRHTTTAFRQPGVEVPVMDIQLVEDDLLDYAIVEWRGVVDPADNEVPCNRAHKIALPQPAAQGVLVICSSQLTTRLEKKEDDPDPLPPSGDGSASS